VIQPRPAGLNSAIRNLGPEVEEFAEPFNPRVGPVTVAMAMGNGLRPFMADFHR